jgi:uncharacterized protein YecE (DUF72 family)
LRGRAKTYVGISGFTYQNWRGRFYPKDTPAREWLRYASRAFNSIELNGTFYSLKSPDVYRKWVAEVPARGFVFAVKGSRFITHNLKLNRAETALANFYASGVLALGKKTGPFLWQLPAQVRFNPERLENFIRLLPRSSEEAESLARLRDARVKKGELLEANERVRYRHAFEVRNPSFFTREFYDLLREHRCGFVIADTAGVFPYAEEITADFAYVRLHGSKQLYVSGYSDAELDAWATRVVRWSGGRWEANAAKRREGGNEAKRRAVDMYVYFDNDAKVHAPNDAQRLAERIRKLRD